MTSIRHNAAQIPPQFRERVARWDAALHAGLQDIGAAVERQATRNLSGGGKPGAYPVPRRSGHLARGMGSKVGQREVVIFNDALYANAVHSGFRAFGNPHAPFYPGRPFLADAAESIDPTAMLIKRLEPAL